MKLLKYHIQARLKRRDLQVNEEELEIIDSVSERYVKAGIWNICKMFPSDVLEVLDAISMFDFEKNLTNFHQIKSCDELKIFC